MTETEPTPSEPREFMKFPDFNEMQRMMDDRFAQLVKRLDRMIVILERIEKKA